MPAKRNRDKLLLRFSLYGFLKNQQYYEPFFLLVLQAKGLSYFQIGLLYSFREVCVNLMGIPAGFLADMYGRRASLVVCFLAYVLSFVGFAFGHDVALLFATMFAFAVGESFRSGTHKAMVFHYLRLVGRESEKATVYGYTRSWSKAGSALSSLLSGLLVFASGNYERIFLYAIAPYLVNIANVSTYPAVLDGEAAIKHSSARGALATMWRETRVCLKNAAMRGLFIESAALHAIAKTVKDYVQPLVVGVLASLALPGPIANTDATRRSAFLLGLVYFLLNAMAALASRHAHRFDQFDRRSFPWLWLAVATVGAMLTAGVTLRGTVPFATGIAVFGFLLLVLLENTWRPLFLDRLDDVADSRYGAAVLSVEAQFSSLGVMLFAPLIGKTADHFALSGVGMLVTALALVTSVLSYRRKRRFAHRGATDVAATSSDRPSV